MVKQIELDVRNQCANSEEEKKKLGSEGRSP